MISIYIQLLVLVLTLLGTVYSKHAGSSSEARDGELLISKYGLVASIDGSNQVIASRSSSATKFILKSPCLHNLPGQCVSLTVRNKPGWYVRHSNYKLYLNQKSASPDQDLFALDASFIVCEDPFFEGYDAFQSVNYPSYYISVGNNGAQMSIVSMTHTVDSYVSASFTRRNRTKRVILVDKFNVQVSINTAINGLYSSSSIAGSPLLLVCPCLFSLAESCVSISPANNPDSFARHYNYKLYIEPKANPRNAAIFQNDASFLVCRDCFYPGYDAYQSMNYPGFYLSTGADNTQLEIVSMGLNPTTDFLKHASFKTIEKNH